MIWVILIAVFVVGVFSGLLLFAWLEKELITKMLLLKAEVVYALQQELKSFKPQNMRKKK
jgi:hypothetical protein